MSVATPIKSSSLSFIASTVDGKYFCNFCRDRSFSAKSSLVRHLRYGCPYTATNKLLYCDACSYSTKRVDNLKAHVSTHYRRNFTVKVNKL